MQPELLSPKTRLSLENFEKEVKTLLSSKIPRQVGTAVAGVYIDSIAFLGLRTYADGLPKTRRGVLTDATWNMLEKEDEARKAMRLAITA